MEERTGFWLLLQKKSSAADDFAKKKKNTFPHAKKEGETPAAGYQRDELQLMEGPLTLKIPPPSGKKALEQSEGPGGAKHNR